ncbi:MAG: hypothetical protein MRY79_09590 [Alphaproteobacteria bacterium]|nr:hypothetical protein [Alphaproteobacteria bacterium]
MNDTLLDNDIPEKFKDKETGEIRTDSLLKSYQELEKKMSQLPSLPKSADEYNIDCNHGMFDLDREMNERLFQKGFTNEQVQFVYDLAAEKMVPMVVEIARDFEADREVEKLIEHFGGAEKWREVSRQLLAFGQKNLPADVLDTLSSSYEGVLALYRMMQGEEPVIGSRQSASNNKSEKMSLESMMRDPKYWRDRDPSFIAEVTEGFKNLYSEK